MSNKLEAALKLARWGLRVFPLQPNSKIPFEGVSWKAVATNDEAQVQRLWGAAPDANIGVACGPVTVVDIDVRNGKSGLAEAALLEVPEDTFTVETASGGQHRYFATAGLGNRVRMADTSGIDIRGEGGYVVGPGSVIDGAEYKVIDKRPMVQVPEYLVELIGRAKPPRERSERKTGSDSDVAIAATEHYLEFVAPLSIRGEGGDQTAFAVAAKCRDLGVTEDTALELMLDIWNPRSPDEWAPEKLAVKVRNAYRYAENDEPAMDLTAAIEGLSDIPPPPQPPEPPGRFTFENISEARLKPPTDWIVKRTLPRVGVASIYGASGSGKSLLMLDLVTAIGNGGSWCGASVKHEGGTVIFAAEAAETLGARLVHAGAPDSTPVIWADCPSFLAGPDKWQVMADGIREAQARMDREYGVPLRMVVVDTYAASGATEEENDASQTQATLSGMARVAKAAGLLVVLIHHPDKNGKDMRGSGAFRGALDAAISVERDVGKLRNVSLTKARGAPERELGSFTVEESVFYDSEGERDSVPVLKWCNDFQVLGIEPARAKETIDAVRTLGGSADIDKALDQFSALVPLKNPEPAFRECVEYLLKTNRLVQRGKRLELPDTS